MLRSAPTQSLSEGGMPAIANGAAHRPSPRLRPDKSAGPTVRKQWVNWYSEENLFRYRYYFAELARRCFRDGLSGY